MTGKPNKNMESEFKVLNQLIATQSMLHVFSKDEKLGDYIVQALTEIPAIEGCAICLRTCTCVNNMPKAEFITITESLKTIPDNQNHFSIDIPQKEGWHIISIHTLDRTFGYVLLSIKEPGSFATFSPAVNNFTNMIAMELENRWHKKQLKTHKLHLAELVEKRTAELNVEIYKRKKNEKALQKSELHYRTLFNDSPIPLWEEDFSDVKKYIDKLKTQKVTNFREYFDEKPEELLKIVGLVKITDINKATLKLHGAKSKKELLNGLESIFTSDSYLAFKEQLIAITKGKSKYNFEGEVKTLKGEIRHVKLAWNVLPGYENSLEKVFLSTVDITESKEMAETVLKEKNKAQQYLNIAEVMLVSVDYLGVVKLINPKGCEIIGYSEDEIVGQNWFDKFLPERLRENVKEVSKKVFAGELESADYYENEILTKAGDERLIAWHNAVYRDDQGKIIGTLSSGEDITERKTIELQLRKSEDRLSKTLMAANDGMWDWNLNTNEVYFDSRYYQMAGYKVDEFSHELQEFQARIHPEDFENVMSYAQMHIKGEISQFNIEFRFKKKNGDWLWVLGRGKVVEFDKNNKPIRFIGTHTDITKRKLAEKELAENEEKYRSLFDNINVGSALHEIILDEKNNPADFIWLDVNPAYEKLTQLKRSDIIGKRGSEIIPNLEKKWIDIYGKVALTGKSKSLTDYSEYLNKYWEVKAYSPIKNQFAVALTDITERKLAEKELTDYREHLEQLVIERTTEVDEKNKKLNDQIKVFVGRELKIRDLEKKIRSLERK